ncbi:Maf family nucleotide pyrophosphatase [Mesonia sp. MT50]|uniref:dTTP/UTP pyrophosphatase n=1 Tax=Mesonia profundi TaxID=3070998 RepID=A0ABU1A2H2_9FLAO|nr:Maf family nucleotide pyrophosphatase [Mesonia profundi]MDQ7917897.1 Maf family nucleotide pyrophosphatase [Mesonia profundi]
MEVNPLKDRLKDKNIILASGSPRRKQILEELGLSFSIEIRKVIESYPSHLSPPEVALYLAKLKAEPFKKDLGEQDILITGDTIVCLDNEILGKPKDREEAFEMLSKLSQKEHQVISSVHLSSKEKSVDFKDITTVHFDKLSNSEIDYYLDYYQPFDKAGAYGIQEWIGQIGIKKIEGSFYTVMGMPTHLIYENLMKF